MAFVTLGEGIDTSTPAGRLQLHILSAMADAALVGGLLGAGILFAAYFVGVALVGAALGATIANLAFSASDRDPASSGPWNR